MDDTAHTVLSSSEQGMNQALKDVYSPMLLLESGKDMLEMLEFWLSCIAEAHKAVEAEQNMEAT